MALSKALCISALLVLLASIQLASAVVPAPRVVAGAKKAAVRPVVRPVVKAPVVTVVGVPTVLQPVVVLLGRVPAYSMFVSLLRSPAFNAPIAAYAKTHQCTLLAPNNAAITALFAKSRALTVVDKVNLLKFNVLGQQVTPAMIAKLPVGQGYFTPIAGTQIQKYAPADQPKTLVFLGPMGATTGPELAIVAPRLLYTGRTMNVIGVSTLLVPATLKAKVVR